ncbi:hypothetical protein MBT84_19905 [Streptomyces sp. MBT84]|uniref:hypothetical protein n=1 Tax=Streptomyces sp. MBT84 TaxID=1488414 RepID=UPI001C6E1239|nr:hypothetical protein [Streptomyces sp. MBT84]MBW8701875.1 hypothetical protein [Streptomyces sp. MBT84]
MHKPSAQPEVRRSAPPPPPPAVQVAPITYLEINGQDVTHCIEQPWVMDHRLHVLVQSEARMGQPNDKGERWVERRLTGKAIAVCSCGYTSGLVDRATLPAVEELAAKHPPYSMNEQVRALIS